jgi:4'-phosphopantetheinyl transferase
MKVFYTRVNAPLQYDEFNAYVSKLPFEIAQNIRRFRRWQDAHLSLFGKLLLEYGLMNYAYGNQKLANVLIDKYDRPYFEGGPFFNISHSSSYVVCVIDNKFPVGIDIEKSSNIDVSEYKDQWTNQEFVSVTESCNSIRQFYVYWTRKEAILKADGRGLSVPLNEINVFDHEAIVNDKIWHLREVDIDAEYVCHVAYGEKIVEFEKSYVKF